MEVVHSFGSSQVLPGVADLQEAVLWSEAVLTMEFWREWVFVMG